MTSPTDAMELSDAEVEAIVAAAWLTAHPKGAPIPGWTGVAIRIAISKAYRAGRRAGTGEPVAWQYRYPGPYGGWMFTQGEERNGSKPIESRPLYAAPVPPMVKETALVNEGSASSEAAARRETRVESGPVQFGDDWPGLFLRGDNALHYAMRLHELLEDDPTNAISDAFCMMAMRGLQKDLESVDAETCKPTLYAAPSLAAAPKSAGSCKPTEVPPAEQAAGTREHWPKPIRTPYMSPEYFAPPPAAPDALVARLRYWQRGDDADMGDDAADALEALIHDNARLVERDTQRLAELGRLQRVVGELVAALENATVLHDERIKRALIAARAATPTEKHDG